MQWILSLSFLGIFFTARGFDYPEIWGIRIYILHLGHNSVAIWGLDYYCQLSRTITLHQEQYNWRGLEMQLSGPMFTTQDVQP